MKVTFATKGMDSDAIFEEVELQRAYEIVAFIDPFQNEKPCWMRD